MRRGVMRRLGLGLVVLAAMPLARGQEATKSGLDASAFDTTVRPQDDLFRYVNGTWLKSAEIPADRPFTGSFVALRDRSEADIRAIIESLAAQGGHAAGSEAQKVADLFADFMDEATAEAKGLEPIGPQLAAVESLGQTSALAPLLGRLQREGVEGLFGAWVDTDAKQSDRYILSLSQAGLGLPDEAYYGDARFAAVKEAYRAHVQKMFELAGWAEPAKAAETIMGIETRLAAGHWDRVKSRDDTLSYNKVDRQGLKALAPQVDWDGFLTAYGVAPGQAAEIVVRQPSYLTAMGQAIDTVPLEDWKTYLKWNVLRAAAPLLSQPFVDESFAFNGKTLTGVPENRPRWKRGVSVVEGALGEALGKLYVEKHFPPASKEKMQKLVADLIAAYRESISTLDWMSPETRAKALDKLAKFTPKIGYPDKWRDYSKLEIHRGDLVGNAHRAIAFETDRNLAKLGKPVDRNEWMMTPQTVNAYYNPGMNEIVFPAAILQAPFFDPEADDAVNYGGIGAVIGHEIGHGFDDQGSKYDGTGNMVNWWTDADRAEFEKRTKALIDQYSAFSPEQLGGKSHVNGALTIGENIGDLGGLSIAIKAYKLSLDGKPAPVIDGKSGLERVLLGWGQIWRSKYRDAELERRLATDPHSPPMYRCNGVVPHVPEFYEVFGVKEGDALYLAPEKRVRIW
jgi:predicted metalloendopeptidase